MFLSRVYVLCLELALARSDFILDMMDFNSDFALIFFS